MLLTVRFARYPLSSQATVVHHDVTAVVVAFPLAAMLRENQLGSAAFGGPARPRHDT